jgi:hypothetical protein
VSIDNNSKDRANPVFDETLRDGQEPLEEVGPGECQAEAEKCEFKSGELEGQPGACQIEHDEEIQDAFPVEEIPIIMDPEDGMPRPADPDHDAPFAHPFTYDVVCIEDDRVYVEVFTEEMGSAAQYLRTRGIGSRMKYSAAGVESDRLKFNPSEVKTVRGHTIVPFFSQSSLRDDDEERFKYLLVRPIRPRCKYYKRQKFAHDGIAKGEFGHFLLFRNCMMRRSVGGAFMSLMNEVVYACDYRDPPDPVTVDKYLDKQDRKTLTERPDLTLVPMFGQEGEDIRLEEKSK